MAVAWIETQSNIQFNILDPRASDVRAIDVAHALANQCRYSGHTRVFYSVAEHCVLMADWAIKNRTWGLARECLVHDAAEAYVGDVTTGLKSALPEFAALELRVEKSIRHAWVMGLSSVETEVKMLDERILADEAYALYKQGGAMWRRVESLKPLGVRVQGWIPDRAEMEYRDRLRRLVPESR